MTTETLRMPRLGETMEEGRLVAWLKEPGESFVRGEVLAEVETDKTVVELPALADGRIVRALARPGDDVAVDAPIAEIEVTGGGPEPETLPSPEARGGGGPSQAPGAAAATAGRPHDAGVRVRATPLARRLARRHGVRLEALAGSGRRGRVEAADVLRHAGIGPGEASAAAGPHRLQAGATAPETSARAEPAASRPVGGVASSATAPARAEWRDAPAGGVREGESEPAAGTGRTDDGSAGESLEIPLFGGTMTVALHGDPDGPPLLLLHGFSGFTGSWGGFPALLARRGLRVVVPDLPAHGATTLPAATPEDLAAPLPDLLAALSVRAERVEIVGHSLGGVVATRLAEALISRGTPPQRLTLLAPAGMGREIDRAFIRAMAAGPTAGALAHLLRKVAVRDPGLSAEILEARSQALQGGRLTALAGVLAHPSGQGADIVASLRRIAPRLSTRIGFGVKDEIIPWTHVARTPSAAAVHLFENAGHMIHWDAPEELAALLALPRDGTRGNG